MDDKTIQAAIRAVHSDIHECISRDSDKHRSEQGAANNLRWIVATLVDCFDNKKKPPASLLYSLRGLSQVADYLDEASTLKEKYSHRSKRKKAEDSLLECFGLLSPQGAPGKDKNYMISEMGKRLCPPVNDDWEPIGEPQASSIQAAAKQVAKVMEIDWRTPDRAWKEYEKLFNSEK